MDKLLDARFERVEKALATLIDSITKFNPSEKAADDLAGADRALNEGLRDLQTHQRNHARLEALRAETVALDARIRDTTATLWAMRKEITATPTTHYPPGFPRYQFSAPDLLDYARRISRNTVPPAALLAEPEGEGEGDAAAQSEDRSRQGTEQPSAAPTPVPLAGTSNGMPGSAAPTPPNLANGDVPMQGSFATDPQASQNSGNTALPEQVKGMTSLGDETLFIPWPADDLIRRGGLAENRRLQDAGIDPRGYDPAAEERRKLEAEQARREEEERARKAAEEAEQRAREERARMNAERAERIREEQRRGSTVAGSGPASGPAAPAQFTFMDDLDNDDDDDDE